MICLLLMVWSFGSGLPGEEITVPISRGAENFTDR